MRAVDRLRAEGGRRLADDRAVAHLLRGRIPCREHHHQQGDDHTDDGGRDQREVAPLHGVRVLERRAHRLAVGCRGGLGARAHGADGCGRRLGARRRRPGNAARIDPSGDEATADPQPQHQRLDDDPQAHRIVGVGRRLDEGEVHVVDRARAHGGPADLRRALGEALERRRVHRASVHPHPCDPFGLRARRPAPRARGTRPCACRREPPHRGRGPARAGGRRTSWPRARWR